ncbi:MAG: hypothetical protein IRZ16_05940 [Myxococcaceae bacterium]|nr:hypothetical protein [Myxococcaceae bacterium]
MTLRHALLVPAIVLGAAASVCGCPRPPPPSAAKELPPPFMVPPGCERNLSGRYAYEGRPDWTYLGADDGTTLVLSVSRADPDGGPSTSAPDAGVVGVDGGSPDGGIAGSGSTVSISLRRTSNGFVGRIEHTAFPAPGVECRVVFPTEVCACDDAGLTLLSVERVAVDPSCQTPPTDGGVERKAHRLVRLPPPPGP